MLIAYDGSPESQRALDYAASLLAPKHVEIITAWEPLYRQAARAAGQSGMKFSDLQSTDDETDDPAYQQALATCREGVNRAEELGLYAKAHLVESATSIWSAIVDASEDLRPDVIVIGTRAETGIRSFFSSSTTDSIVHNTNIPVFVVPPEDNED
ncbi:universal stress protein [Corynebacterium ciconiae]|uniref:universal stress protein n=1 Tax=Corynebacterium ciconiae TaxID=227319 RepID=UPI00058CF221|nr:universal stress protein [Corynebacterium ciconiae]